MSAPSQQLTTISAEVAIGLLPILPTMAARETIYLRLDLDLAAEIHADRSSEALPSITAACEAILRAGLAVRCVAREATARLDAGIDLHGLASLSNRNSVSPSPETPGTHLTRRTPAAVPAIHIGPTFPCRSAALEQNRNKERRAP